MRASEFLNENASSGATAAGSVASVVKPLQGTNDQAFFGASPDDYPPYGSTVAIIRRPSPTAEMNKKKKGKIKAGD